MRRIGALLLLVLSTTARGREYVLGNSLSPDGRYQIVAEEVGGRLGYRVHRVGAGPVSSLAESGYSPCLRDAVEFAWSHAADGEVSWRPDGRFAAVTEANHRHIGWVLFFARDGRRFVPFRVSDERLFALTRLPWERGRSFFGGWGAHDTARLSLAGRLWHEKEWKFESAGCTILIDLDRDGKVLGFRCEKAPY